VFFIFNLITRFFQKRKSKKNQPTGFVSPVGIFS
jgi:hypothetical protein